MAKGTSVVSALVFHAVVLAGGKSSRMGQDKALIQFPQTGETWLLNVVRILRRVGKFEKILVSGFERNSIELDYVKDASPAEGPLAGLHSVFQKLKMHLDRNEILLILPIDMPFLNADTIEKFVSLSEDYLLKGQSVYVSESLFPILIPLSSVVFDKIEYNVLNFRFALKELVSNIPNKSISLGQVSEGVSEKFFENINTPLEWQQLLVE